MLIVDPRHWLNRDGTLPFDNPRLFRKMLRVAQVIEYGGTLGQGESREMLVLCSRRPARKQCLSLLWVTKTPNDELFAFCPACGHDEMLVHHWQRTHWADGMMEPVVAAEPDVEPRLH